MWDSSDDSAGHEARRLVVQSARLFGRDSPLKRVLNWKGQSVPTAAAQGSRLRGLIALCATRWQRFAPAAAYADFAVLFQQSWQE
ncbi:hypothetical protein JX265_004759 [Neoarthrinium moseri]|uniref:Uncharacterized protein n=1 Tax=Neoarthrinium moseri TaxID=1658444 RepID=A0A9P9WQ38_9PEZI|nr:hypothetical protein JX266_007011 [Neoarthrinium moseri]KAI1874551.1 hypothetical protein JX265_004759 [Neoarthrinium moseri]